MFVCLCLKLIHFHLATMNNLLKSVNSLARQDRRYAMTDGAEPFLGNMKHPDTVIRSTLDLTLLQ